MIGKSSRSSFNKKSVLTPNNSPSCKILSSSGIDAPLSHLETDCLDTPSFIASSSWDHPCCFLSFMIFSAKIISFSPLLRWLYPTSPGGCTPPSHLGNLSTAGCNQVFSAFFPYRMQKIPVRSASPHPIGMAAQIPTSPILAESR